MPTNHLSVSIAHRANPETQALSNSSNKTPISVGLSEQGLKKTVQAREVNMSLATKELLPPKSAVGFLLMDSNLNLISSNVEAAQILSYPDKVANLGLVTERILSTLMSQELLGESPFVAEFQSGRRRYFCRAFHVDSQAKDHARATMAVLLERGPSGLVPLSRVSQRFKLTQRERETLECLLHGLSSKEIANRMNVSPNTVKAILRMIMAKMRVSSRSAVMRKIIMTQPQ